MRFHFGLSFRPKNILKYIGLGIIGLLAFIGVHDFAKAETVDYSSVTVVNSNNQQTLYCPYNSKGYCPNTLNPIGVSPSISYTAKQVFIQFANTPLSVDHDYNFVIDYEILYTTCEDGCEQSSYLFYQYNGYSLEDTVIYWQQSIGIDYSFGSIGVRYTYSGNFTAQSNNNFYSVLTLEDTEHIYGVLVKGVYLYDNTTDDSMINTLSQNTIDMINNQNENTLNIIDSSNNNTNSIINNNNSNTQEIKDTINDNLQSCRNSLNLYQYGNYNLNINFYFQDKLLLANFENNTTYTLSFDINTSVLPFNLSVGYGDNNSYLVDGPSKDFTTNGRHYITFTTNRADYSYLWIRLPRYRSITQFNASVSDIMLTKGNMVLPYEPYGQQVCSNKIDNLNDSINNTNQSIEELNDTITDETLPDIDDSTFGDLEISSETAISDLITMPITILRALNNNLGNNCTPYTIPFGLTGGSQTLTFPCIHPEEYLGSTIWNYIDLFICFFMIYNIAMLIISSFESITSLEDTFNSLYEPRHADTGYKPKHGGD